MRYLSIISNRPSQIKILAHGGWNMTNADAIEAEISQVISKASDMKSVEVNLGNVENIDTYGAWLAERLKRELSVNGANIKLTGIKPRNAPLLKQVALVNFPEINTEITRPVKKPILDRMDSRLSAAFTSFLQFFTMFGSTLAAAGNVIRQPRQFRLTSTVYQLDRVIWQALPIVLMVTLIIGAIIAQQGFFHFRRFGADLYVVDMVGFLIMREIGVLLVAIVIAGRSGSSYTAELGSMKMREEIDALKTMGFDPVTVLLLPRILVLMIALPVLTFIGSVSALFGAGIVAITYAGMTPDMFLDRLNDAITMDHFLVGLIKAPFIGLVIGIIACAEGLQVQGSATSLGKHTTQSVVKSIFMVILMDGLFALFFSAIRM